MSVPLVANAATTRHIIGFSVLFGLLPCFLFLPSLGVEMALLSLTLLRSLPVSEVTMVPLCSSP